MNLVCPTGAATQGPGQRHALLICNGTFPNIPDYQLAGPSKDAHLFDSVLSDPGICGFAVCTLVDSGLLEVRREIARICAEAGKEDALLVYYSGNGLQGEDGSLFLLVADSERDYPWATALDADFILSRLRHSACRKIVLLIDACHAGAFFAHNRGIPNGLYAITSCDADELCTDTPEGGAFTVALCAGLRGSAADIDGDGRVSIDELHEFVKDRLRAGAYSGTPRKWVWNVPEPIYVANVPRSVFLSYAREDMAAADQLGKALEAESLSIWVDREDIQSGNWEEHVTEGLNRSRAVVMLLTAHSLNSDSVRRELAFAAAKNVPIVPVELVEIQDESLPNWFIFKYGELHRHRLDSTRYNDAVKRLASAIRTLRKIERSPTIPA